MYGKGKDVTVKPLIIKWEIVKKKKIKKTEKRKKTVLHIEALKSIASDCVLKEKLWLLKYLELNKFFWVILLTSSIRFCDNDNSKKLSVVKYLVFLVVGWMISLCKM